MNIPGSLDANEVYSLTAYLLFLNHIVPAETTLDAATLAKIEMPARDRFVTDDRQQYREVH
jgi:cytochrome c